MLNKKLLLFCGIFIILGISLITAGILITKDKPLCQEGICLAEKIDLNVIGDNGDILINNDLRVSDGSSTYQIETLKDIKEVRYIQTLTKDSKVSEISTTYSKQPNQVYERYHFMFYDEYEEYCGKFKSCLPFDKYTYQVLAYDDYTINTKRIDQTTGEIYPTTWDGSLKTEIPNSKLSVSFNDIVHSSNVITINGNDIQWINFTRFLHDVAPNCYYENASGQDVIENISSITTPCQLVINHSASIQWENASLIFDGIAIGDANPMILMGNKSVMNLSSFSLGIFSGEPLPDLINTIDPIIDTCIPEDASEGITYSPNCGEVIFNNVNVNGYGNSRVVSAYIMNGTFNNVKFSKAQPGFATKVSNIKFNTMHLIDVVVLGARFEGTNLRVDIPDDVCFNPVLQNLEMNLVGGYFNCTSLASVVLAKATVNITDPVYMSSTNLVNVFYGVWQFYLKKTIDMKFRGDNCTDEVDTNVTMVDAQGTSYNDKTTDYSKVVDVYFSNTTDEIDFNPFTFNLTNSSYFPVTDFKCNFTETDQKGVWKMYEIPYAIELNPGSSLNLKI